MASAKRVAALACCKLYVSTDLATGAGAAVVEALQARAAPHLLHTFPDTAYGRVGFTLAGPVRPSPAGLQLAVVEMVDLAVAAIDLTQHRGAHPRLGVVDHICFHPLGSATVQEVAVVARAVAAHMGSQLQVPAFLYGAAHPRGVHLADLRRALGYFTRPIATTALGQWEGAALLGGAAAEPVAPDFGPPEARPATGAVAVGACPWVANYNVPLRCDDLKLATRIAKAVSERGGGLPCVQAMALRHGHGSIEVACNLLDATVTGGRRVQERVAELAAVEGVQVEEGYDTGYSEEEVLRLASRIAQEG